MSQIKAVLIESIDAIDHVSDLLDVMFQELALHYPTGLTAAYLGGERAAVINDLAAIRRAISLMQEES